MWLHLYKWAEGRRAAASICEVNISLALAEEEDEMAEAACFSSGLVWSVHGLFILFGWP